ncbi:uncharacterized protein LOC130296821 [Hyla sarda]|uniref:uncharacterized protein LOC130296821 n=1 Tax=Hyla sarda TaxID=327740 RepID=UPI0024C3F73F|nr:uncharacterized protein LOC130296821 [Hyla sarda]
MGLLLSTFHRALLKFTGYQARILMCGLDAAGKTTILYKLKLHETVTTIPTIAINVETVEPVGNVIFTLWDIGGGNKMKQLYPLYYPDTDGVIFVVDSNDPERFPDVGTMLNDMLEQESLRGVPFMVLANKQDVPSARRPEELAENLGLDDIKRDLWHIQGCCATTGEGLAEGMEILAELVKQFKNNKGVSR